MEKSKFPSFSIIRHRGIVNKAQLPNGTWVYKRDFIYIKETDRNIICAPYDDHFIYEIPQSLVHLYPGPAFRCTCGSVAGWVGPSGYILDASAQGLMFVCLLHAERGIHSDGGSQWV